MTTLLLVCFTTCLAGQKLDVSIEDAKRFADWKPKVVAGCVERAGLYSRYLTERRGQENDRAQRQWLMNESFTSSQTRTIYSDLHLLVHAKSTDTDKLSALVRLRRRMGRAAYDDAKLPPTVPEGQEADFKKWLEKCGKTDPMPGKAKAGGQ